MAKRELKQDKPAAIEQPKISYDAWWAMVNKRIPDHHHKEVVLADFMGRGLSKNEPLAVYNKALEQYGLKLK